MTDRGLQSDHCQAWLTTPAGSKTRDDALDRSADVLLSAMMAVGNDDPHRQLEILTKVKAMVLAGMVRARPQAEYEEALYQAGPAAIDEVLRFMNARKRDRRDARRARS